MRGSRGKIGYLTVKLILSEGVRRTFNVHRLVCLTFNGPPPSKDHYATHDDGVRDHNKAANLFWKLPVGNYDDAVRHGTAAHGERSGRAKLTQAEVDEVKTAYGSARRGRGNRSGVLQSLADKYRVSKGTIKAIAYGANWSGITRRRSGRYRPLKGVVIGPDTKTTFR